jgi:hypothetical protein
MGEMKMRRRIIDGFSRKLERATDYQYPIRK